MKEYEEKKKRSESLYKEIFTNSNSKIKDEEYNEAACGEN